MADDASGGALAAIGDGLLWFVQNIGMAFYNFGYAITHPGSWLNWSDNEALMKFIYYGFRQQPQEATLLLKFHDAAYAVGGVGSIVRDLTDKKMPKEDKL